MALEIPLINCEINFILTWSADFVIVYTDVVNQGATFAITETKRYVPVVTLSTQGNSKLLQQLKSAFKRIINWNEYLSKPDLLAQNPNLNQLILSSFQAIKQQEQTIKNIILTEKKYSSLSKKWNTTGHGDDYKTGCLLDYSYFKNNYTMTAMDLSKQQALDADPKAIQQINFTTNLDQAGSARIFFTLEEAKETVLDFSQGTVKVL